MNELNKFAFLKNIFYKCPCLKILFLELTKNCNLNCIHCGSNCPNNYSDTFLKLSDIKPVLDDLKEKSPSTAIFITGGEPLLNPEWENICKYVFSLGFNCGMTTNGTLVDDETVIKLHECGVKTISVSLDGLKNTHENFRQTDGCFDKAVHALSMLKRSGLFYDVQATTVVGKHNFKELNQIYNLCLEMKLDSWKITEIEPIGLAKNISHLELSTDEKLQLYEFILNKKTSIMEISYVCSHFLPLKYDKSVRRTHYICGAGTYIASITADGDITACLDIDDIENVRQGNIFTDNFWDVWENKFQLFRKNKALTSDFCVGCQYINFCQGESWHTWSIRDNQPKICNYKEMGGDVFGKNYTDS